MTRQQLDEMMELDNLALEDAGTRAAHGIGEVDCETPYLVDFEQVEDVFREQARRAMDETEWEN